MADEKKKEGKRIIAVGGLSHGTYKGTLIFDTPYGFFVAIGTAWKRSRALRTITAWIDEYFQNKQN